MYQLSDSEMDELWVFSRDATVLFSISASCLSFAFGLWLEPDPGMEPAPSSEVRRFLVEVGVPFFTLAAAMFASMGYFALRRRRRAVEAIAERSRAAEEELLGSKDSTDPGIAASAREPSRTLLRW